MHYSRWLKHGDPLSHPKILTLVEFWERVDKSGPISEFNPELGPCWIWLGPIAKKTGYGYFGGNDRDERIVHRISFTLEFGPIPDNREIDHLCRNRACLRPSHLEAVTSKENTQRGLRGRLVTHCPQGHEYTLENIYLHHNRRECLTCYQIRNRSRKVVRVA